MALQRWRGDFSQKAGKLIDARLFGANIDVSKTYADALKRAGHLTLKECERILQGLEMVRFDWIDGLITIHDTDLNIQMVNERRLQELVGDVSQCLNAGRSSNDQSITDLKVWLRKGIQITCFGLRKVIEAAIYQAEEHMGVLMPGYTHLQRDQPVQFSHWLLSHAFAMREDCVRLRELRERANVSPLGSGAQAGNAIGIDRIFMAKSLGFTSVTQNSMHAVRDRDCIIDFVYSCSIASLHLSQLAEDLILYATQEFDFIQIADGYCSGSRFMPQKRNPDSLEYVRGITGCICSSLTGIMMTIKGTPSSFNQDLQFDKQYCFDAFDKLQQALSIIRGIIKTMKVNRQQMELALSSDMLANDWVYYLVRKGVSYTEAYRYIENVVHFAENLGLKLTDIPLGELMMICPHFDSDLFMAADYDRNVQNYDSIGGTASVAVVAQLTVLKEFVSHIKEVD